MLCLIRKLLQTIGSKEAKFTRSYADKSLNNLDQLLLSERAVAILVGSFEEMTKFCIVEVRIVAHFLHDFFD